ncbi:MAG: hypothetical protein EAZ27_11640 [Cytophagales bacterium]|nr:MAG: hypothetical protein EAZ27_11640 [Cytophagales bacterium]
MIFKWFNDFFVFLKQKININFLSKYYIAKLIIFCFLLSIFFAFPPFHVIYFNLYDEYWLPILKQISDPFHPVVYEASTHAAKRCFRLTVPVFANIFGLKTWGCIFIQYVFGFLNIWLTYKLFIEIFNDIISATFLTISLVFIYLGFGAFYDLRGMFDTLAVGFLLLSMYFKNPIAIFIFIIMCAFTDERGLVASSFIWVYYSISSKENQISYSIFSINKQKIALISAWTIYFVLRIFLTQYFGFYTTTNNANLGIVLKLMNNAPLAIWSALEGFWLLLFPAFYYLFMSKNYYFSTAFAFSILISLLVGMSVFDLTRSVMYIYPSVFVAGMILNSKESIFMIQKQAYLILILCFLFPSYYFYGILSTRWCYPLPFRILHILENYFN